MWFALVGGILFKHTNEHQVSTIPEEDFLTFRDACKLPILIFGNEN